MRFITLTLAYPSKGVVASIDVNPEKICRLARIEASKDSAAYTHVGYGMLASPGQELADLVVETPATIKELIQGFIRGIDNE